MLGPEFITGLICGKIILNNFKSGGIIWFGL